MNTFKKIGNFSYARKSSHKKIDYYKWKEYCFKTALESMRNILNKNNQEFFLACGTLLGCIRNNSFIPHDQDIDIGIFANNFNSKIKDIILHSEEFTLKHELGKLEDSYEVSFFHKKTNVSIDIFLFYPLEKHHYYCASFYGLCDQKPGGFCRWKYPITALKPTIFYNKVYLIPANAEEHLTMAYGSNWKTPIKFGYQSGLEGLYRNLMD